MDARRGRGYNHPFTRFYLGGVVGRHHDHWHFDRDVVAGGAGGPRGGAEDAVPEQPQADRTWPCTPMNRRYGCLPPGAILRPPYPNFYADYDPWFEAPATALPGYHGTSWMLQILPFMEQQALFDQWDFTKSVIGNKTVAATRYRLSFIAPRVATAFARMTSKSCSKTGPAAAPTMAAATAVGISLSIRGRQPPRWFHKPPV